MFDYGYKEESIMNLRDSVKGIVKGQNDFGLYIDLKIEDEITGECNEPVSAFGYWAGRIPRGTEVTCSVKRWAKDNRDILVNVDSVEYDSIVKMAA